MVKLYRHLDAGTVLYWEAWDSQDGSIVVHWGEVGQTGTTRTVAVPRNASADEVIERECSQPRAEGYHEMPLEDHYELIVQHRTVDAWGDVEDLRECVEVEDILNECLGWTGNGHCDGHDIGSGTTNVYAFVVDVNLARDAAVATLRKMGHIDGVLMAVHRDGDFEVVWPEDYQGEFSIF